MTIYLIHGLLESSYGQYAPQIRRWRGRRSIVPLHLPGHADSTKDAGPRLIEDSVELLGAAIERHGPGHVIAASYLGGPVAVRYALRGDARLSSLVLMGLVPDVSRATFGYWVTGFHLMAQENQALAKAYENTHGARWRATLDAFAELVERAYERDVAVGWSALEALEIPTLIANGSHKSNELGAARQAQERGRMLRGHVFDGAGHVPSRDCPEDFAEIVESFWATCEERRPT